MFLSKQNLKINSKTIFIPSFIAFWVFIAIWLDKYGFGIKDFSQRSIGTAAFHNIDIKMRIQAFYNGLYAFIAVFVLVNFIFNFLRSLKGIKAEISTINNMSFLGLVTLILQVFQQKAEIATYFVLDIVIIFVVLLLLKLFLPNRKFKYKIDKVVWSVAASCSICVSLYVLLGLQESIYIFPIVSILLLLFLEFAKIPIQQLILFTLPLSLLPLLIFISQETFMVLNQREVSAMHPRKLFIILLAIVSLLIGVVYYWKKNKTILFKTRKVIILHVIFAFVGILFVANYKFFIETPNELFEIANPAISLMSFFEFGKLPVLDFLNAHFISDCVPGFIYFLLNGYENTIAFHVYDFLFEAVAAIIFFFFLKNVFKSIVYALLISILLPFVGIAMGGINGSILLLIPIALYNVYRKPNLRNLVIYFFLLLFEVVWRPDTGFSALIAMTFGFFLVLFLRQRDFSIKTIIYSLGIMIVPFGAVIIGLVLYNPEYLDNIKQALEFVANSPQARGLGKLSHKFDRLFYVHHFVFPITIAIIFLYTVLNIRGLVKKNSFVALSIFLLSIIYLSNFQRGLTRHSFYELTDGILSMFAFLIISLSVFYLKRKARIYRFQLFLATLTILIISFKFPEAINYKTSLDKIYYDIEPDKFFTYSESRIDRVVDKSNYFKENVEEIKAFIEENIEGEATFFDFSNTPYLYFATSKPLPVYFIHLVAITNDALQEKQVEALKSNDVPYVIFSHNPPNWWDNTDGVPNTTRYYKIAEYIYQNYSPYAIVGKYKVWKQNKHFIENGANYIEDTLSAAAINHYLRMFPYVWANADKSIYESETLLEKKFYNVEKKKVALQLPIEIDKSMGNFIIIELLNGRIEQEQKCTLKYWNGSKLLGSYSFDIRGKNYEMKYAVRISSQYNWYSEPVDRITIDAKESFVKSVKLTQGN